MKKDSNPGELLRIVRSTIKYIWRFMDIRLQKKKNSTRRIAEL